MLYPKFHCPIATQPDTHSQFLRIFAKLQTFLLSGRKFESGIQIALSVVIDSKGEFQLLIVNLVHEATASAAKMKCYGRCDMKTYVCWLVCGLYFMLAGFCGAADSISIPLDCKGLQASGAGQQRIEVPASGFSVIPPQGEHWCVRSMASGFTFLKHPANVEIPAQPPSPNDLFQVVLQTVRFMGIAVALPEFGTQYPSPDQLKVVVDELISNHFFSQVVGGISSAERHFQLVDSHSAIDGSFGASCVRFDAKVEELGAYLAPADVVINLNFFSNLVCAHPQPTSAKSSLVWISFVEVYREGDQSAAAALNREVEPFLRSLEFTGPKIVRYQIN